MSLLGTLKGWLSSRSMKVDERRWVILDVETSGLDPYRDRLLAIAAVAIHLPEDFSSPIIHVRDSFEVVLHQDVFSDKDNILVHGIGVGAQRGGEDPAESLRAFETWIGNAPLLAFHAPFDEALIQRACQQHLGKKLPNPWLDIEPLARITHEQVKARSLDEWMSHFGIECAVRHQAAADTFATAELLLQIWPGLRSQARTWRDMATLAANARWISRA